MTTRARQDWYQILGVERDASPDEIKNAYRALVHRYHPDHNPDNPAAEAKFIEVSEAYATLSDPVQRRRYDASLAVRESRTVGPTRPAPPSTRAGVRPFSVGLNVRVGGISLPLGGISLSVNDPEELRSAVQRALRELIESLE